MINNGQFDETHLPRKKTTLLLTSLVSIRIVSSLSLLTFKTTRTLTFKILPTVTSSRPPIIVIGVSERKDLQVPMVLKISIHFGVDMNMFEGADTLANFSCKLSRNFVATQVARTVAYALK